MLKLLRKIFSKLNYLFFVGSTDILPEPFNKEEEEKYVNMFLNGDMTARDKLIDILMSYKGYRGCHMILVFDAYKVPQNKGKSQMYHDMEIVYTKEGQTADAYIESITKQMAGQYRLVVATSDNLEQKIVLGHGATRISSRELLQDVISRSKIQKEEFERKNPQMHSYAFEDLKKS